RIGALDRLEHFRRAPHHPDRLAAPLDNAQLAWREVRDVLGHRRTGRLGALGRPHARHEGDRGADSGSTAYEGGCDDEIAAGLVHFSLLVHGDAFVMATRESVRFYRGVAQLSRIRSQAPLFSEEFRILAGPVGWLPVNVLAPALAHLRADRRGCG